MVSCANDYGGSVDIRELTLAGLFTVIAKARVIRISSGSGWPSVV